jgi:hypothetical protein
VAPAARVVLKDLPRSRLDMEARPDLQVHSRDKEIQAAQIRVNKVRALHPRDRRLFLPRPVDRRDRRHRRSIPKTKSSNATGFCPRSTFFG